MAGGTSDMQRFIQNTDAKQIMLVTECGMSDMLKVEHPEKEFIAPCIICPHMKRINLENVLTSLKENKFEIKIEESVRQRAFKSVSRMLELS